MWRFGRERDTILVAGCAVQLRSRCRTIILTGWLVEQVDGSGRRREYG